MGRETKKTNMIWIMADQLRADMVGCNGDPNVHTPNIDALAQEGVNFYRAVSTYPLCCPARGTMLTGIYPNRCTLGHEYRMPVDQKTIANVLSEAGYHTAWIGKWHLDGAHEHMGRIAFHHVPKQRRGGFDYWMGYENNNSQFDCYVHGGGEGFGEISPRKLEGYETDCLTDIFLRYLEKRPKDKPFFAVLSVQPPHNPYVAPERNRNYRGEELKLRPNMLPEMPPYEEFNGRMRANLANAYAMIENYDENVGRIVDYLKENGLYEDTVILFFSDHGDAHGAHGQERKTNPLEESIRVPFIVGGKRLSENPELAGIRMPHVLATIDIAPTSLGLLGIRIPKEWEGCDYSLLCHRKSNSFSYPTSAYIQNIIPEHHTHSVELPWRGVVTMDGWKYVCLEGTPWMLFDLNQDPYELRNMALCGIAREKRAELHRQLEGWLERTGDKFILPKINFRNDLYEDTRETFGYPYYEEDDGI